MKENRLDYIPAEQDSINVLYLTTREDRCEQLTVPPPIDTLYTVVPATFSCVNQSPGIGDFVFQFDRGGDRSRHTKVFSQSWFNFLTRKEHKGSVPYVYFRGWLVW